MPVSSCCQEDGEACGPFVDQERKIEKLRAALKGMVTEFERQTAQGSPMAISSNPRYRAALEALSETEG